METMSAAESAACRAVPRCSAELRAIYFLALVLGATGLVTGLNAAAGLAGAKASRPMFLPHEIEPAWSLYDEMHEQIAASGAAHRVRQAFFVVAHLIVAAGLLAGAVGGLRAKAAAKLVLLAAFCAGIFLELARLMPSLREAREANHVVQQYAPRMLRAISGPAPARGADGISPPTVALVQAAGKMQALTMLAVMLFKCIFYGIGARCLTYTPPGGDNLLTHGLCL